MISVAAAALIAATGFANAQGTGMGRETPSAAPAQSSPSTERAAPSEEKMQPQGNKMQRTQGDMKAGPKGEKSAQENGMQRENPKSKSSEMNEKGAAGKDMKAEERSGNMNAESKSATENKSQTVGQAAAGAKLTGDQRTRITSVIREQHVQPLAHVNFSLSVGTRVPRDVSFHPLPTEIVEIYPDWRGYEFVLVGDQIVVVNPETFEIVAVIEA
jgi:hypothetical protein